MKNRIYVGITKSNELYFLEIEQEKRNNKPYFTMSGTTLSLLEADQAEKDAEENLRDGEMWRQAVEGNHTTLGLDEWVDLVLNTDGWENQYDLDHQIGLVDYEGKDYYFEWSSTGQHQEKEEDIKHFFISKKDFRVLMQMWKDHHMKEVDIKHPNLKQDEQCLAVEAIEIITGEEVKPK